MSGPLIVITALIYLWVAVDQYLRGNVGLAVAYSGYAYSNIGLYILAR
jgi:hypothetical protein